MKFSPNKLLCLLLAVCILSTTFVVPAFASTEVLKTDVNVEKTFNQYDQVKLEKAIDALTSNPIFSDLELAKAFYKHAFSTTFISKDTVGEILDQVFVTDYTASDKSEATSGETSYKEAINPLECIVPTLYNKVPASLSEYFKGEPNPNPTGADLVVGDILLMEDSSGAKIFIYDGKRLVSLAKDNVQRHDANTVLASAVSSDRYVVLRPSMDMDTLHYTTPEKDELSDVQKALYETAEAYLLRGFRVQYDDLTPFTGNEYRWNVGLSTPEESTIDNIIYTNCAAFVTDVYINALGHNTGCKTTSEYRYSKDSIWLYTPTGKETDEEKAAKEAEFCSILQPGDIINIRYKSSGGHAMLYVGNGNIIHSTGSNHGLSNGEVPEASIQQMRVKDLFDPAKSRYVFTKLKTINLVRPLKSWSGTVPQNTINRITTMKGIVGEKLSSKNRYKTVNPGDEITYTFRVYNTNEEEKTIEIKDTVPENTTYVSGGMTVSGRSLSHTITVPANETREVSYTVKVNNGTPEGTWIESNSATIGGVIHKTYQTLVKETLTSLQQDAISTAVLKHKNKASANDKGIAYLNAIYKDVLNIDKVILHDTLDAITEDLIKVIDGATIIEGVALAKYFGKYYLKPNSYYGKMIVPRMYGGRKICVLKQYSDDITKIILKEHFLPGDILIDHTKSEDSRKIYMYTKDGLLDLATGEYIEDIDRTLDILCASDYFAVLRPTLTDSYVYTKSELESEPEPEMEVLEDVTTPEETIVGEDGKVWFALNGNSKLFMNYNSSDYTNRTTLRNYLPGVDYGALVSTPYGYFGTDKDYVLLNGEEMGVFQYTLDKKTTPALGSVADFTTKNGNIFWTINGVDYLVKPDRKVIKVVAGVKTDNILKSGLTDEKKNKLIDRYNSLSGMTIDVPDGKYEKVGFLTGIFNKWTRNLTVTLVYEDSEVKQDIVVLGKTAEESDSYAKGVVYFDRMNDLASGTTPDDLHYFVPHEITTDSAKTLKSIKLTPNSPSTSYFYPLYVLSAWGEKAPDVSGEMSIVYKKNQTPYIQVSIANPTKIAGFKYKVVNGFYDKEGVLLGSAVKDGVTTAEEKQTYNIMLENIPANTYEIRAYIFSDFDELIMLSPMKIPTEKE